MTKSDFMVNELFQFDGKWYGILRVKGLDGYKRYVQITNIYQGGFDWATMNETMENAVQYFHEKDNSNT